MVEVVTKPKALDRQLAELEAESHESYMDARSLRSNAGSAAVLRWVRGTDALSPITRVSSPSPDARTIGLELDAALEFVEGRKAPPWRSAGSSQPVPRWPCAGCWALPTNRPCRSARRVQLVPVGTVIASKIRGWSAPTVLQIQLCGNAERGPPGSCRYLWRCRFPTPSGVLGCPDSPYWPSPP